MVLVPMLTRVLVKLVGLETCVPFQFALVLMQQTHPFVIHMVLVFQKTRVHAWQINGLVHNVKFQFAMELLVTILKSVMDMVIVLFQTIVLVL